MRYLKYVWLCFYLFIITIIFSKAAASGEKSAAESNKVTDIVIGVVDDIRKGEEPIADKYGLENARIFIRKAIGHFGIFLEDQGIFHNKENFPEAQIISNNIVRNCRHYAIGIRGGDTVLVSANNIYNNNPNNSSNA